MKMPKVRYPGHYSVGRARTIGGSSFADRVYKERMAFLEGWTKCWKAVEKAQSKRYTVVEDK